MCIRLKTIRGRNVSMRDGSVLYLSFLFFFTSTYTLRDGWQSIDIRGNEVGVLQKQRKHTNMLGNEEGRSWHLFRREWGEEGRKRPFALFYDLWLIFCSVYMNCWAGVWTVATLLSGLQNRESSIAALLPADAHCGDVSGGKPSLYLSIKRVCRAPTRTHRHAHTQARARIHTGARAHRLFRGSQGCLSHFGRAGQVQCSDQRGLRECCLEA